MSHCGLVFWLLAAPAYSAVPLVADGKPLAVVVTSDHPSQVAKYAAEELVSHIRLATGVSLDVVTEGRVPVEPEGRVFVGDCGAARAAGVQSDGLAAEAFVLRSKGSSMFIVGSDGGGDPLNSNTLAGTLWGVYEWLERELHATWLWPGENGTFVPEVQTVTAHDVNDTIPPRFFQRKLRPGLGWDSDHPSLGFSPGAFEQYKQNQTVFLRRHRMGRSLPFSYGHAFVDWWKKEGKVHPDWFQLRENGQRGPSKSTGRFSMCVSNPEFQKELVARWAAKQGKGSTGPVFLNACENDILGQCSCANCRALDGAPPPDYTTFYSPNSKMAGSRFVSDRYAHFWLSLQQMAESVNPEANVVGYVYFNYFHAPVTGIKLNPRILLGYCPSGGFYPRSEAEHEWMKQQWTGWSETGARLFMRTNHLLDGYCMPYLFAHQFADEFHHAASHGMVATDYDSLTGHWATQGPGLYVAVRLHTRPEATADDLLAEYYAAFGKAGPLIKVYFDYWENYTTGLREEIPKVMEAAQASRWRSWAKVAHELYPPACFARAETLLEPAVAAVKDDPKSAARVTFLQQGLQHAKQCAASSALFSKSVSTRVDGKNEDSLRTLIDLRRSLEKTGISNFNHLAWMEDESWMLPDEKTLESLGGSH